MQTYWVIWSQPRYNEARYVEVPLKYIFLPIIIASKFFLANTRSITSMKEKRTNYSKALKLSCIKSYIISNLCGAN